MWKFLAPAAVVVGMAGLAALAQTPAPPTAVTTVTVVKGGAVSPPVIVGVSKAAGGPAAPPLAKAGSPSEAAKAEAAVEPPKPSPRMEKLKQLQFDRRPSAVLKAWAPEPKADGGKKPAPPADPKAAALDKELAGFRKAVALGEWGQVKTYLASLPDEESIIAYKQLLQSLRQPPGPNARGGNPGGGDDDGMMQMQMMQMNGNAQQFAERNAFAPDDVIGLAAAAPSGPNPTLFVARSAVVGAGVAASQAPKGVDKAELAALAGFLREAVAGGTLPEVAVARLKAEVAKPAGQAVFDRRQAAKLLTLAGQAAYTGDFLPSPEQAQKGKDLEGLNLLSRHYLALQGKEEKAGSLEKAWQAVQAVLAYPDGSREQQEEALLRAVELAPRVVDKLGQAWLDESFTKKPERGMEILATVGTLVSQGLSTRPFATDDRLNALKLMKTAVEALLKAAPAKAAGWRPTLTLLAAAWYKEADFSRQYDRSSGSGPRLRRDMYGNMFYTGTDDDDGGMNRMMFNNGNMPRPVLVGDVLRARPNDDWVKAIDDGFRPKLADLLARLHLKVGEEDKAFPLIEHMAVAQPDEAKALVKEFLRVWTRNHDPNGQRNESRYSWFFYGFENRAESIPLTRSKQERNLQELAGWVARIRKLPKAGDVDDEQLVKAFTACHSTAEVYKTEAIETVFGPIGKLKPRTLAGLAQQMRTNLAGLWRDPAEQTKKKTNRKKKDIEAEVLRGYEVANAVVADGLKKFPDHWALLAAKASLLHDEINYRQELSKSSTFSARRNEAFALYQTAAGQYAKDVPALPEDERTNLVFDLWFAAALGAVDLGMITEEKHPDFRQPPLIRAAILALPGEAADKQMGRFANDLFTKMSGAKPHVKYNYLKAGFEIVGDRKEAVEAKKVFDYYKDLVREIKLDVVVDGPSRVGHGEPFGLFVNLRHTRDIERESGGFGRYLQNQNANNYFSYNYGRPTADYRDRFEAAAKEALKEHFEVLSVTFQAESVHSRAAGEFGWRYTPYAYVLLKARGPQVDKIPPLRIDLDFLDTSGYAVFPVESPAVPVDCKDATGDPRPVADLAVTQTLDERQADKGVLLLEVKAVGVGLVPPLAALCGPLAPAGFEVTKVEDQGLGVKKFEEDADKNAVVSERVWQLTLKGLGGQAALPTSFHFADVKVPTKTADGILYQRFNDADLASVGQDVSLERSYGAKSQLWLWALIGFGLVGLAVLGAVIWLLTRPRKAADGGFRLPSDLNAFTALELLQRLKVDGPLTAAQRDDLDAAIIRIEEYYFAAERTGHQAPDLRQIIERWAAPR